MGLWDSLGYVGDSLDKATGSRALRGVLGGKPRELLSIVPFSDRLGITDEKDIVSGRNLTDKVGLTRSGDPGLASALAGFAADAALDPSNLVGGLGVRKLAKANLHRNPLVEAANAPDHVGLSNWIKHQVGQHPLGSTISTSDAAVDPSLKVWREGKYRGEQHAVRPNVPFEHVKAAIGLGPEYPGGFEKLQDIIGYSNLAHPSQARKLIGNSPLGLLERLSGEIPEGSRKLGEGAEAIAMLAPGGHVIRIGDRGHGLNDAVEQMLSGTPHRGVDLPEPGRPNVPQILQPVRSVDVGPFRVEHMPYVDPLYPEGLTSKMTGFEKSHNYEPPRAWSGASDRMDERGGAIEDKVRESLRKLGLSAEDVSVNNIGATPQGRVLAFDPGMILGESTDTIAQRLREGLNPIVNWVEPPDPARLVHPNEAALLRKLGAPSAVRDAIAEGLARGTEGQGIAAPLAPYMRERDAIYKLLRDSGFDPSLSSVPPGTGLPTGGGLDTSMRQFAGKTQRISGLPDATMNQAVQRLGFDPATARRVKGVYSPGNDKILTRLGVDPGTIREERGHSMVSNAIRQGPGSIASLPLAWQPGAWAKYAGGFPADKTSGLSRLGRYLDEIGQSVTRTRGPLADKLMAGLSFATDPEDIPAYANLIAGDDSPVLRSLMMAPVNLWQNRVPLALGAMGTKELAQLAAALQRQPEPY